MRAMSLLGSMIVLAVLSSPVTAAQQQRPSQPQSAATAGTDKKACDFLSKEEAESILSQPVELKADYPKQCQYVEVGFTNKPPKNKLVSIDASTSSTPQPNEYVEAKKNVASFQEVKEVSDVGDAAVWLWIPGFGGSLYAYKAGTITVAVIVNGLPEDTALQHAKTLAAKPLGGLAGTGYVYAGTPKHRAAAAADASVERSVLAKLLQEGKTFSQAPYITERQFLELAKDVSLDFMTDPSLNKYISATEQRGLLERALDGYGIAIRDGRPVTLRVRVRHFNNVLTKTYIRGGASSTYQYPIHTIEVTLKFLVRAGAWRSGTVHVVMAAPAFASRARVVIEASDYQKRVEGEDSTVNDIKEAFTSSVMDSLQIMVSDTKAETTPWQVNGWAAKDKASADAEFAKVFRTASAVDKRPLKGITTAPELDLASAEDHDFCTKPDSSWRELWSRAFERVDLAPPAAPPTLRLRHFMNCHFNSGSTPVHYFWYYDRISLVEDNLVFEFNGGLARRPGELLYGSHSMDLLEEDTKPPTEDFLPRSISDFAVDLASR